MIDQKFSGEIIDDLVGEAYQLWREEFGDRLPWNILLATHCLAEVRNISSLSEPANKILKAVCTLFDKKEGLKFVEDRMLSSIERIGTNWPHRDTLAKWLMEWDPKGIGWFSAPTVGAFIGGIGGGSDEVHRAVLHYGQHENKNYRVIAPSALGRGWHNDPSTLPLLRKWAEYDGDEDVRRAALIALGTYFRSDVQSRALLLDRSRNDPSKYVRWIAMVVASMAFGNSPEASNLLKDRAINDKEEIVRSSALDYLRLLFASEPHTIPFLCDRARSDFDSSVRFGALYGLVENFREHPETISLLLNRAVNDVKESVRSLAISTLIEHFALDAHIASLIRDRLENDPSENLRNHVRELMQKFSIL